MTRSIRPGRSARWNRHRTWYDKATPQLIYHVVFGCSDLDKPVGFYRDRLKFRITDVARDRGVFFRAQGRSDHHNIFWARTGKAKFLHISFGVENLDELLAGANDMQRKGWRSGLVSAAIVFRRRCISRLNHPRAEKPNIRPIPIASMIPGSRASGSRYSATSIRSRHYRSFLRRRRKRTCIFLTEERPDLARIVRVEIRGP